MAKTPIILDKNEFQKVVSDLEKDGPFGNMSALWQAVEDTQWAKTRKPRPLMAATAGVKAIEMGLTLKTQPGKRGRPSVDKIAPKSPSSSSLQMSVMDIESKGPFESFDKLCDKLAEIHQYPSKEIRSLLIKGNIVTKTPKGSMHQPEFDEEEEEEEEYTPTPAPFVPVEVPKQEYILVSNDVKVEDPDIPVEDRAELSDRYKLHWKKWYEQGIADKAAGKSKDTNQIPVLLPLEEGLPNLEENFPVRMWMNAYLQGYNGKKVKLHCIGQIIPTEKARGMSWKEWNIRQEKSEGYVERF